MITFLKAECNRAVEAGGCSRARCNAARRQSPYNTDRPSACSTAAAPDNRVSIVPPIPTVLITGASRGLGRGIAIEAAAQGLSVAINYASNRAAADATAALCRQVAPDPAQQFVPVAGDISRRGDRLALFDATLAALGRIDALINNAGIAPRVRADITEASEESFEEIVRTNLQGPYFLTQRVARHWLEEPYPPALPGGFKIVFVTSISADTASVNRGDYCISKAGLAMASQLWAARLAAENVQVVELRPGIMATDMTSGVKEKYDRLIAEGLVPQRRWGSADDVGRAVRAILAGSFPYTTGDVIHLDGGFHMRRL
jgi:NAD(P)-dependent dehydrogenase (short-subunit alcohol dehydrogenase family)